MPIGRNRKREELPGSRAARQGLGSGDPGKSPFGRTAEYPGYKNRKQARRGGTRRSAVTDRIKEIVDEQTIGRIDSTDYTALSKAEERKKAGLARKAEAAEAKAGQKAAADEQKRLLREAREDEVREQKRINLAAKTAARKEADAQRKRDRAQARQAERDRKAAARARAREEKRRR